MAAEPIVVIDAGTSALRAVAVAADGVASVIASEPWTMRVPGDCAPFGRELDAVDVTASLDRLVEASVGAVARPAAVAFTGQREGVVFLEGERAVLVSPNVDARASGEGMAIDARCGGEVYAATGHLPSLLMAPPKLAWLREHRPDDAARVDRVLPLADWLATQVDGKAVTSRSLGVEIGVLDVRCGEIPASMLEMLGLPTRMVAPVVADGAIRGTVRSGTWAGTPVVRAGADTQCALLGMGAVAPGECGVAAGWSAPVQLVTQEPMFDAKQRTWTGFHVAEGWILESNAGEAGRVWDWACSMFGVQYDEGDALAGASPPGARDTMSVLGPRVMRASQMRASTGGVVLPLPLVMGAPSRGDVLRSVLEGVAFAIRANLEQLEEVGGKAIAAVRVGGGMSRSATFTRILATVLGRPILVARAPETSAVGAAVLASVAIGRHDSMAGAVNDMAEPLLTIEARPRESALYDDLYARWCEMSDHLENAP